MSKIISLLAMLLLSALAKSQTSEQRTLTPFNEIEVGDGITVVITQAKANSLTATAESQSQLRDLITEVSGKTLIIRRKSSSRTPVQVTLSATEISAIKANDRSLLKITNALVANDFFLSLSSGSVFSGDIKADSVRIVAQSRSVCAGNIEAKTLFSDFSRGSYSFLVGTADKAMLTAMGESNCNNRGLSIKKAIIDASGNSFVQAKVSDALDISLDENSRVSYYGEAHTTSHSKNIKKLEDYVVNGIDLKNPPNN